MTTIITVVRDPSAPLGKHFAADGTKRAAVTISRGVAVQYDAPTAEQLAAILQRVQSDPHAALILSSFPGIPLGEEFDLLSEQELQATFSRQDVRSQVFRTPQGRYVTGRFIERVRASDWLLFDRDTDGQTPAHFGPEQMPFDVWLGMLEMLLPGVSSAPRVHLPSSSARVLRPDGKPVGGGNGHLFVLASGDSAQLKVQAEANAIRAGIAWQWRNKGGACSLRTICDLSVWTPGRLVFDGAPTADAPLRVAPPAIAVSAGVRPVDLGGLPVPSAEEFRALTMSAGVEKVLRNDGRGGIDAYDLPLSATIETEDRGPITVGEAVNLLREGVEKLRVQTPFRESVSYAGVLRLGGDGKPALYDVGTGTTHWLTHEDHAACAFAGSATLPPGAIPLDQPPPAPPAAPVAQPWVNRFAAAARSLASQADIKPQPSIVYGLLSEASISMLWGPPGAAKSFVAAALARSIATGDEFLGKPVRQGRVLYVSTEGNVRVRFAADGLDLPDVVTLEEPLNLMNAEDVACLAAYIKEHAFSLVIYDVFSECVIGDENSTEDMQMAGRGLRAIRDTTGAAQLIVHHSNKDGSAARGSSVLKGFADNELRIVREPGADRRTLRVEKCRDGRDYYDLSHFDLTSVDLGEDLDPIAPEGARRTAARIEWVSCIEAAADRVASGPASRPPLAKGRHGQPSHEQRAFDLLRLAGSDGLDAETWLLRFSTGGNFIDSTAAKKEFRRVHARLAEHGYTRSEVGAGGVTLFKLAHDLEVAEHDAFARFASGGPPVLTVAA